jgi:hypothetical protein
MTSHYRQDMWFGPWIESLNGGENQEWFVITIAHNTRMHPSRVGPMRIKSRTSLFNRESPRIIQSLRDLIEQYDMNGSHTTTGRILNSWGFSQPSGCTGTTTNAHTWPHNLYFWLTPQSGRLPRPTSSSAFLLITHLLVIWIFGGIFLNAYRSGGLSIT